MFRILSVCSCHCSCSQLWMRPPLWPTPSLQVFDPVVRWAREELGVGLQASHSIFGADLADEDVASVRRYLLGEMK